MKRLSAILFSLLLVWMQVAIAAPAPFAGVARAKCACCDCGKAHCCVTESVPASPPAPLAPAPVDFQSQLSLFVATTPVWTLPGAEARGLSAFNSSPLTTAGVPLFTRDCALLI